MPELPVALDEVGRGDATVAEATRTIREALREPVRHGERVYAALRDLTWRTISSRSGSPELPDWFDLIRHAAALARRRDDAPLAGRLSVLSDLIGQSARFADRQPLEEVLGRKHVVEILTLLHRAGGTARRAAIAESTGLADANLSRVLVILSGNGLVKRLASGKEALFELTEAGRTAVEKTGQATPQPETESWWNDLPIGVGIWGKDGRSAGCNKPMRDILPDIDPDADWQSWRNRLGILSREVHRQAGSEAQDMLVGPALWVRCQERTGPDGLHIAFLQDVSREKLHEQALKQRIAALNEEIAALRAEHAELDCRLLAHQRIVQGMRKSVVELATSARSQIYGISEDVAAAAGPADDRPAVTSLSSGTGPDTIPTVLSKLDRHLNAMALLAEHLVDVPGTEADPSETEVVSLGDTINQITSVADAFGDTDVNAEFDPAIEQTEVHSSFRSLLSQVLMTLHQRSSQASGRPRYHMKARKENGSVLVSVDGRNEAPSMFFAEDCGAGFTAPISPAPDDLMYCKVLAEQYGGELDIAPAEADEVLRLKYPFKPARTLRFGSMRRKTS